MSDTEGSAGERRNSLVVMCATLLSRLLGIVKARVISSVFGASGTADVINFTFNIPNNFRKLFAEGAVSAAFIPVISDGIQADPDQLERPRRLFGTLIAAQIIIFVPLSVLTALWAPEIISFISDFHEPAQRELSAQLLVWFVLFLATISIANIFAVVLQSHARFVAQAFAPLLMSLCVIFSILFLSSRLGAFSMAFGVVAGGFLQAFATYIPVRKLGYRLWPNLQFRTPDFSRLIRAWSSVAFISIILVLAQQVSYWFASALEQGSVTALSNAIIFWQTPYGIFFTAIATVLFPQLSVAFSSKDESSWNSAVCRGLENLCMFMIPSALILFFLRHEVISAVLQTGLFTAENTRMTAKVLTWYLAGMTFSACYAFLQRCCYSRKDYRLPLIVSLGVTCMDIFLTYLFIRSGLGIQSLSLAAAISQFLGFLFLYGIVLIPRHGFSHAKLVKKSARILIANVPLLICGLLYVAGNFTWWERGSSMSNFFAVAVLGCAGLGCSFVFYRIARIDFVAAIKKNQEK
ncbi:murein biosynthesis integral membrane protein MurJ [Parasphaerochaeta coccoides]|uniref:Lipid II flippase n=1 Tax=Parasphaerochaeta coccoides (strain ATCC BAA-1237 / DSM 17374 / SPN1) TaxID=760011 RepID=F4GK60_PARC1|nr:murein biosynthesis integral membrane protein MurJ [Parasphaerochaeta coccoides]AEC01832.1 integral membrane protein MviN [Parasphaerochaeta coccoides DSM 17374]